jgi:hypothetical protein
MTKILKTTSERNLQSNKELNMSYNSPYDVNCSSETYKQIEPYILNESNMISYLKYDINDDKKSSPKIKHTKKQTYTDKSIFFIPKGGDTLFWCYYVIEQGEVSYEMLNSKNIVTEKQYKIELIQKIRDNKSIVKTYKLDTLNNIENNLANEPRIHIKTVMSLFAIDKKNILFVKKQTYASLILNDTDEVYVIQEMNTGNKYVQTYGYKIIDKARYEEEITKLYKMESLDKPIKSISSYKLQDLLNICEKLNISIVHENTEKKKTKHELYEDILQYFY